MASLPVRILIVDAHPIVRQGVSAVLSENAQWSICGEVATAREAAANLEQLQPDLIVLELGSDPQAMDAVREISSLTASAKVLVFGASDTEAFVQPAFRAGASGFVLKSENASELKAAVEAVASGGLFLGRRVSGSVLEQILTENNSAPRPSGKLTLRQRQVVQLLASGRSNKEVGLSLGLTGRTVETHRRIIMKKLGIGTFSDLVRYALYLELVPPWPAETLVKKRSAASGALTA